MNKTTRLRFKRALDVLTTGSMESYTEKARRNPALVRAVASCFERNRPWRTAKGVQGLGVSRRRKKGRVLRAPRLVVYVKKKLSRRGLALPVPRRITIPGLGTFATDVVEIGLIRWHAFDHAVVPLTPGVQIQAGTELGTIGAFVRSTHPDLPGPLLLTAGHVLFKDYINAQGLAVHHPLIGAGPPGGVVAAGQFGTSKIAPVAFPPTASEPNVMDAGLAQLDPSRSLAPHIISIGVRPTKGAEARDKEKVRKVGAASEETAGIVFDVDFTFEKEVRNPAGGKRKAVFKDMVQATYQAKIGDSGALVLNASNKVVGLHVAGATKSKTGIFCQFLPIEAKFGLTFL